MKLFTRMAIGALLAFGVAVALACGGEDGGRSTTGVVDQHEGAAPDEHAAADHDAVDDGHEPAVYEEDGVLEYHIRIDGYKFVPSEIEIQKGQTVRIVLDNHDAVLHDYAVDEPHFVVLDSDGAAHHEHEEAVSEHGHDEELVSLSPLHVAAEAGQHSVLVFRAEEAGTFEFYCSVEGHRAAGMVGTLKVVD